MPPFSPSKNYDPPHPHQSFPVGWGFCLNLLHRKFFYSSFLFKYWSCDLCWDLQGLEWDELKTVCEFPLTTSSVPRVSSWCGLPGESLSPTEHAIKLGEVCWFVTSCGSPFSLSWAWTPRCFNLFMELWVSSPVSSMGGSCDCFPVSHQLKGR